MLFVLRGQHFGTFAVEVQDQEAGLSRPFVAGVLADAIDKAQTPRFKLCFQLLLTFFIFFKFPLFAERVPGSDERGTVGVLFSHQLCELRAGQADLHFECWLCMDEIFRLLEGLDEFGGDVASHP